VNLNPATDSVTELVTKPEPYRAADVQSLPVNNLPYRTAIAQSLTVAELEQRIAEHLSKAEATEAPELVAVDDKRCQRVLKRRVTLWAGPGLFYEAINELPAGRAIDPVLQTTDGDQKVWWQLRGSNWIQTSQVEQTGECPPIPVTTTAVAPNTNFLSLETCQTRNGPLRAGQQVTIQFIPPAWEITAGRAMR
jgi:hypothetical protein